MCATAAEERGVKSCARARPLHVLHVQPLHCRSRLQPLPSHEIHTRAHTAHTLLSHARVSPSPGPSRSLEDDEDARKLGETPVYVKYDARLYGPRQPGQKVRSCVRAHVCDW